MLVTMTTALACAAISQPLAEPGQAVRYDGDKVVTVVVQDEKMRRAVLTLSEGLWGCAEPGLGPVQVHVTAQGLAALDDLGLAYIVEIDNVQTLIDAENARLADAARGDGRGQRGELPGTYFDDYRTNEQISEYMNALAALRPDLVTRQPIGQSTDGREIYAIRVTAPGQGPKPIILMNSLQHAREWITGATGSYIIDRLVRNPDVDPRIDALLNDFEIILVPVLNPDGYAWTWSNDRMWRKNRRPAPVGSSCMGVDNNRNWGAFWGLVNGSSGEPCGETYRGVAPFSEPENQAMRDFATAHPRIVSYVDIHSYGRHILSSYGHQQAPPEHVSEVLDDLNNRLMAAISAVNGPRWRGGPTFSNLYAVSGGSKDWFFADRAVLGWVWELGDESSFVLPPTAIMPSGREILAGVLTLGDLVREHALRVRFAGPGRPARVAAGVPTPVQLMVSRGVSEPDLSATRLWYRLGRVGAFTQAALTAGDGGSLIGQLPAAPCGAVMQYYVEAATTAGGVFTSPRAGANEPFEAAVSNADVYASWDMETPAGWNGWAQGEPNGTAAQPDHAQQGVQCWMTGNSTLPGGALSSNDVDGAAAVRLTSGPINLAGRSNVTVSYWRWFCANIGSGPNIDVLVVEASPNGVTWHPVETVGPGGPQARRGWFERSFRLDAIFVPTSQTRIRFSTSDTGGDTFVEAALDNVRIYSERCAAPCAGDWTRDGVVDAGDVAELINAWFADQADGTLHADFDGNGVSNSTDVSDFINAWFVPC